MKLQPGDYIKIIDWDNCTENIYQYLGKADDWYCSKGFSRRLKPLDDSKCSYVMLPDSFLRTCDIVKVN